MDLNQIITELLAERELIDRAIAQVESLTVSSNGSAPAPRSRAGRKSMGEAERREVSERMKKYWAARRKAKGVR